MRSFEEIYAIAAHRKGGPDELEALLESPKSPAEVKAIPEDRWLALMAQHFFATGLNWKVIEAKWAGFEEAFNGFDVDHCAMIADDRFDDLLRDKRIVRHGAKIQAVQQNAVFLQSLRPRGGIGEVVAEWPATTFHLLLDMLKTKGSRLGGSTGPYTLRHLGCDSYILSRDVTARLIAEGVIDKPVTSKRDAAKVQDAFNTWMDESGRGLTQISRTLAMSL